MLSYEYCLIQDKWNFLQESIKILNNSLMVFKYFINGDLMIGKYLFINRVCFNFL
jgi:hypothetical protein